MSHEPFARFISYLFYDITANILFLFDYYNIVI